MNLKLLFLFVCLLLFCSTSFCFVTDSVETKKEKIPFFQKPEARHHIKTNLINYYPFRTISLMYECALFSKISIAISGKLMRPYPLSVNWLNSIDDRGTGITFSDAFFKGFAVTPELRFYFWKRNASEMPRGVYIAPYARVSQYTASMIMNVPKNEEISFAGGPFDMNLQVLTIGAGLMVGSQFARKHFVIDWWIAGLHLAYHDVTASVTGNLLDQFGVDKNVQALLDRYIGGRTLRLDENFRLGTDGIRFSSSVFPSLGARVGLCIGFRL